MEPIADGSALGSRGKRLDRPSKHFQKGSTESSGWATRQRVLTRTLLVFVGLGVLWRVSKFIACPPIWGDEAFIAVNLLIRDFAGLLQPLEYYQIAPAGFLWAELAIVKAIGASEWSIRLLPFLSGLVSLGLFVRFAGRTVDRRSALLAVGIFAASFYPVRHANEVKPYATDLMFSLMTMSLAWSLWLDRNSLRRWLAITGLVVVGVWFSYPLVFVAAGVGTVLAYRVYRPDKGTDTSTALGSQYRFPGSVLFLVFGLVTSTSFLISYVIVAGPQSKAAPFYSSLITWRGAFPPLSKPWLLPHWLLDVHTGNMLAYPMGGNNFGSLVTALLVLVGCLTLKKTRPALLVLLLSPLVPTFLASVLHRYPYGTSARITLYMAPSFCLLAGVGAVTLFRKLTGIHRLRAYRLARIGLVGLILGCTVGNVVVPYKNFEDSENRRAVVDLARLARHGDLWVVYDGVERLPVSNSLMNEHFLQQMAEVRYNLLAKAPVPMLWRPEPGSIAFPPTGRTWLIVHRSGCPRFDEGGLLRMKQVLAGRLGEPQAHIDRLTRGESIEAFEYSSPTPRSTIR